MLHQTKHTFNLERLGFFFFYLGLLSLRFFILVHVFDSTFKTVISSMLVTNLVIERERERERGFIEISHRNRQKNNFENEIKFSELK